ncbi:Glyoxalase/Bleomycin resistance protein/Dihydroxybiphenyl dioxygenase [Phialemonium atrogriseum]|uniref:Glyoxalase/Bleomycin resistance protein/Dihydroxybiphenyl dioxygenase n=1 Tax=Phialemonium atrogriseum TaxID=1093897 RepID=A0AAJ0BPY6_9PEZI|nr:Glyoxalase/Bleomycin resistance protein/Dihydroxybiphenyl dioxygenase [Phialemonium atrogriseum]KAK1762308.1 Glyoxalase/Bleomycin resistance protein/Dihydroxybiphenyl dioxygenase [Phialemonium atrogriseum]
MTSASDAGLRKINLVRIAHVYYTHKGIAKAHQFLQDFGLQELKRVGNKTYYGGTGPEPFVYCASEGSTDEFGGAAFVVESKDDLEYAAKTLHNATEVHEMLDEPGGGLRVTFFDPVDGFPFHLVYGQRLTEGAETGSARQKVNYPTEKLRAANQFQRFEKGPAPVHKLGHFGMCVTDFAKAYSFYTSRFNLVASDLVHDDNGQDVTTFLHLDRGSEMVDHHCFFFFQGPKCHVHHSSFETVDFDTQLLGHDWLREKGYENCWGVGRHIMGSQIFDYWFDPSRFILEHYVDGDLVNSSYPTNISKASPNNLHIWGPDLPPTFLQ